MKRVSVQIDVTADDIQYWARGSCYCCPVARAIRRVCDKSVDDASVGLRTAWIGDSEVGLPEVARTFILQFDQGKPVTPISFPLEIPEHCLKAEFRRSQK